MKRLSGNAPVPRQKTGKRSRGKPESCWRGLGGFVQNGADQNAGFSGRRGSRLNLLLVSVSCPAVFSLTLFCREWRSLAVIGVVALWISGCGGSASARFEQQRLYCESLEQQFLLQHGDAAKKTLTQLKDAAETLYRMSPESVPAVYYLSALHFHQVADRLETLPPEDRPWVCIRLKRTLNRVLSRNMDDTDFHGKWPEFEKKYDELAFCLGVAVQAAQCP